MKFKIFRNVFPLLLILVFALLTSTDRLGFQKTATQVLSLTDTQPIEVPHPITNAAPKPDISAQSAIIYAVDSQITLYEKNSLRPLPPASTTKIMTSHVVINHYPFGQKIIVTTANQSVGSSADLSSGETLTVQQLLYALMLNSGNDAAVALAQSYPGGYSNFIKAMNDQAEQLGLTNSHFTNVSGIDEPDHFMSARDLAVLTSQLMSNLVFADIVATREYSITDSQGNIIHQFNNLNQLLGTIEGVNGVKTGKTDNAGECLVTSVNRENHRLIIVIMGSHDRFGETIKLINWAYTNFQWLPQSRI